MWIDIKNKMLQTADGKIPIFVMDDAAKKAHDDRMKSYERTGEKTKEAIEQDRIRKIITGEGE